ncbi:hypothetical protein PIB30_036805 [Stylosanthes scabra]|uniref:Uncharacterized protein n=1 Tax=Stylosanthes scabra TaxID=79078 RepID=A0ABU6ZB30_9FABA|nr:hypothetical protein [Stylosanthes scabra]
MTNQDEEGVVYIDHSSDDQRRDQQQQQTLDLNATANEATRSGNANTDSGGIQNRQPRSAFDRIGPGGPTQRPFGGTGLDESQIAQELRHRMQVMELEEPATARTNSAPTEFPVQVSLPTYEGSTTPNPLRRRRHHSSSDDSEFSSGRDRHGRRRDYWQYKRTRDRTATPPVDSYTPFSSRILKVKPPKHFVKPTDMKYDGSTDLHIHLNDFEHRMIYDGAVDEVKC